MTRYRVPVSVELLTERDSWNPAEGFRLISVDAKWAGHPGVAICTFEDDNAPAELEGKLVEPVLHRDGATVTVIERNVVPA